MLLALPAVTLILRIRILQAVAPDVDPGHIGS
jgi:hypothetical protein